MGIQGLLPLIKPILRRAHISDFRSKVIGIDGYVWLHKSLTTCSIELATGSNTLKYVDYCMQRIEDLRSYGVKPFVVFDGDYLPQKKITEVERENNRKSAYKKGIEFLKNGDYYNAKNNLLASIDVTPEMCNNWSLHNKGIPFIVAPYEADAQLAYLIRNRYIDIILTEDSDTIPYLCPHVLFKLDNEYYVDEYRKSDIYINDIIPFKDFSDEQILWACVLSGCDYAPSPPGIGLKTAIKIINQEKTLDNIFHLLRVKYNCTDSYFEAFHNAIFTFHHQYKTIPLTPFDSSSMKHGDYIGKSLPDDIAKKVAMCLINPITKLPFTNTYNINNNNNNKVKTAPVVVQSKLNFEVVPKYEIRINNNNNNNNNVIKTPIKPKRNINNNNINNTFVKSPYFNSNSNNENIYRNEGHVKVLTSLDQLRSIKKIKIEDNNNSKIKEEEEKEKLKKKMKEKEKENNNNENSYNSTPPQSLYHYTAKRDYCTIASHYFSSPLVGKDFHVPRHE